MPLGRESALKIMPVLESIEKNTESSPRITELSDCNEKEVTATELMLAAVVVCSGSSSLSLLQAGMMSAAGRMASGMTAALKRLPGWWYLFVFTEDVNVLAVRLLRIELSMPEAA